MALIEVFERQPSGALTPLGTFDFEVAPRVGDTVRLNPSRIETVVQAVHDVQRGAPPTAQFKIVIDA